MTSKLLTELARLFRVEAEDAGRIDRYAWPPVFPSPAEVEEHNRLLDMSEDIHRRAVRQRRIERRLARR